MLLYLQKQDVFLTPQHIPGFVGDGWTQQQVEIALNDLAVQGQVEFSAHLDGFATVFLMAHLKRREGEHES